MNGSSIWGLVLEVGSESFRWGKGLVGEGGGGGRRCSEVGVSGMFEVGLETGV